MFSLAHRFLYDRNTFLTMAFLAVIMAIPQGALAWGREGHQIIVIVAEHYMRPETAAHMRELLAPERPEEASAWADEYGKTRATARLLTARACDAWNFIAPRDQRDHVDELTGIVSLRGLATYNQCSRSS